MGCGNSRPKTPADVCYEAFEKKQPINLQALKEAVHRCTDGNLGTYKVTETCMYTPLECIALNLHLADSAPAAVAMLVDEGADLLATDQAYFSETPIGLALRYENGNALNAFFPKVPKDQWEEVAKDIMEQRCKSEEFANRVLSSAKIGGCPNGVWTHTFHAGNAMLLAYPAAEAMQAGAHVAGGAIEVGADALGVIGC